MLIGSEVASHVPPVYWRNRQKESTSHVIACPHWHSSLYIGKYSPTLPCMESAFPVTKDTRPTFEHRKTLDHIRSINPNMIDQPRQLLKIKMLNGTAARNHPMAIPALACGVFCDAWPWEMIWKNIHYIWFSHFTSTESHWCWKYSLSLYSLKTAFQSVCAKVLTHWLAIETVSIIVGSR